MFGQPSVANNLPAGPIASPPKPSPAGLSPDMMSACQDSSNVGGIDQYGTA
jgi:hypothetical protein